MSASLQSAVAALAALGCNPQPNGSGYTACCPVHEADGRSHTPSLTIKAGNTVPFILHCHAGCHPKSILAKLNLKPEPVNGKRRVVATYAYQDAAGIVVSEKLRYEPKGFGQRWPDGKGGAVWKKPKDTPAVLYRLPELIEGIAAGRKVFVVEGEKDADRLALAGLTVTTTIDGASKEARKPKWKPEYTAQLANAGCLVLIPDHDGAGRAHMANIAQQLKGKVADIRWLELPGLSGAKGSNDVSDWLNDGHTVEELTALVEQVKPKAAFNVKFTPAPGSPWRQIPDEAEPPEWFANAPNEAVDVGSDKLLVSDTGKSLIKHNDAAALLYEKEFGGRLFYDPIMLDWFEYQPDAGVFEHRPGLAIEQAVYRAVTAHRGTLGFDAAYISGVTKCLLYEAIKTPEPAVGKICFTNGVLDIATRELLPHSPEHYFTTALPYEWLPDAPDPTVVIDWLRGAVSGHDDQIQLIRAYLNAIVVGRPDLQRFLEVIGAGGSGKGTLIRLATAMIGKDAVHSTSLKQLEENRFETAKIFGKKLVVINDAEKWHGDVSMLKSITGEDAVRFEQKHKQAGESFTYRGMVIIAANQHTDSNDYSSGIQRRRITIPFDHVVPACDRRDLEAEFEPHLPALLKWVLDMPQSEVTAYLRNTSAHTHSLRNARLDALAATNPMVAWMLDNVHFAENVSAQVGEKKRLTISEGRNDGDGKSTTHVEYEFQDAWLYPNYCQWCDANGKMPVSKNQFSSTAVDAAKNLLGKTFVRHERKSTGRYIVGMTLELPPVSPYIQNPQCRPVLTNDDLMTTQVTDCAELDDLSNILEVNEFLNSLDKENSLAGIPESTDIPESTEYGESCSENDAGRQVKHIQQDRSSLGQHKVSTRSSFIPPVATSGASRERLVSLLADPSGKEPDDLYRQMERSGFTRIEVDRELTALAISRKVGKVNGKWVATGVAP